MNQLAHRRREYAELVVKNAEVADRRILDAFASVPRENFLGRGPWCVSDSGEMSPTSDPEYVYQDIVIALDASKGITNGLPSLHARCIEALAPSSGDCVVHIGPGTGYFTALLADLVGPAGSVTALELDPVLAEKARINLRHWPNVAVHHASGTDYPFGDLDGIYVSAGAASLPPSWLDGLKTGGRLLFPLVPAEAEGAILHVTRGAAGYSAKFLAKARFYPCIGAQPEAPELRAAFVRGDLGRVRSLIRGELVDSTCWYHGSGWWLSTSSVEH
jgi:protein-L-isoaspartate(D-aspartate) O-methyltransferase